MILLIHFDLYTYDASFSFDKMSETTCLIALSFQIPLSSEYESLRKFPHPKRIVVMNKTDLADPTQIKVLIPLKILCFLSCLLIPMDFTCFKMVSLHCL